MATTIIEKLIIYPVKSLMGVEVESLEINKFGPINDRRYMLVNSTHRMITQRTHAILSQFKLEKSDPGWKVISPDQSVIEIRDNQNIENVIETKVWKSDLRAREKSTEISAWFSEQLGEGVKLVELDDPSSRLREYQDVNANFGFADGYPLLICNQTSLAELSNRIDFDLSMNRFRPNVVISIPEQSEYQVQKLQSEQGGSILFVKPCVRCNVPAIEQNTSVFQKDLHKVLRQELRREDHYIFGMNAISSGLNQICVGDEFSYS